LETVLFAITLFELLKRIAAAVKLNVLFRSTAPAEVMFSTLMRVAGAMAVVSGWMNVTFQTSITCPDPQNVITPPAPYLFTPPFSEWPLLVFSSASCFANSLAPSVFGRNLQCEPVRKVGNQEECHWSHACSLQVCKKAFENSLASSSVNFCRNRAPPPLVNGLSCAILTAACNNALVNRGSCNSV
jgi:hypothetical protein